MINLFGTCKTHISYQQYFSDLPTINKIGNMSSSNEEGSYHIYYGGPLAI